MQGRSQINIGGWNFGVPLILGEFLCILTHLQQGRIHFGVVEPGIPQTNTPIDICSWKHASQELAGEAPIGYCLVLYQNHHSIEVIRLYNTNGDCE